MIGWKNVASRDYAEAIWNGLVDEDLDRMLDTIMEKQASMIYPNCPGCGDLLRTAHVHVDEHTGKEYTIQITDPSDRPSTDSPQDRPSQDPQLVEARLRVGQARPPSD